MKRCMFFPSWRVLELEEIVIWCKVYMCGWMAIEWEQMIDRLSFYYVHTGYRQANSFLQLVLIGRTHIVDFIFDQSMQSSWFSSSHFCTHNALLERHFYESILSVSTANMNLIISCSVNQNNYNPPCLWLILINETFTPFIRIDAQDGGRNAQ